MKASVIYRDLLTDLAGAYGNAIRMLSGLVFKEALKELFRQIAS